MPEGSLAGNRFHTYLILLKTSAGSFGKTEPQSLRVPTGFRPELRTSPPLPRNKDRRSDAKETCLYQAHGKHMFRKNYFDQQETAVLNPLVWEEGKG